MTYICTDCAHAEPCVFSPPKGIEPQFCIADGTDCSWKLETIEEREDRERGMNPAERPIRGRINSLSFHARKAR